MLPASEGCVLGATGIYDDAKFTDDGGNEVAAARGVCELTGTEGHCGGGGGGGGGIEDGRLAPAATGRDVLGGGTGHIVVLQVVDICVGPNGFFSTAVTTCGGMDE